jgi:hypothetical protein
MHTQPSPNTSSAADAALVSVSGRLNVTYRNGRYGPFPVGTLHCVLGTFTVRDQRDNAWLETLDSGDYDGIFALSAITLYSYQAYGELRVCLRAMVEQFELDGYDGESDDTEPESIPDPLEEEGVTPTFSRDETPDDEPFDEQVQFLRSFLADGDDWQYGDIYHPDTSIGRENLIRCRQILTAFGYQYDMRAQSFYLPQEVVAYG